MKRFQLTLTLGMMLGAATLAATAQATPLSLTGQLGTVAAGLNPVEQAQFILGGRHYCFYLDGWHGPGFYWCGYAFRRGYGWGGPEGWHGWSRGGGGHGPIRGGHGPARVGHGPARVGHGPAHGARGGHGPARGGHGGHGGHGKH